MPDRYRQVAVADVDVALDASALREFFIGREAYRRTRFIVVRSHGELALIEVIKNSDEPLFSPIVDVQLLAGPGECASIVSPDIDTGVPSMLALAADRVKEARCVIVTGLYQHVSFILDPDPVEIVVNDVVPPRPAKLMDQAHRVLAVTESIPPVRLIEDSVDLSSHLGDAEHVLLPCRGGGVESDDVTIDYLDQRPPRRDWTLIGCRRSRQIHQWFYGDVPADIDFCPVERPETVATVLTRCCMLEEGIEIHDTTVVVPWGATLENVRAGLTAAVELQQARNETQPVLGASETSAS